MFIQCCDLFFCLNFLFRLACISMTMGTVCWKTMTSTITCTLVCKSGIDYSLSAVYSLYVYCIFKHKNFLNKIILHKSMFQIFLLIQITLDRTGSNPKIRRNKIWGGQNGGILVYNSGLCFSLPLCLSHT